MDTADKFLVFVYMVASFGMGSLVGGAYLTSDEQIDSIKKEVYIKEYGSKKGKEIFECRKKDGTLIETDMFGRVCIIPSDKFYTIK